MLAGPAAALATLLAGCALLNPSDPALERTTGEGPMLVAPASADHSRIPWSPVWGRMAESTRLRHVHPDRGQVVLWSEALESTDSLSSHWAVLGRPRIAGCQVDSLAGLEVLAPPDTTGECGLERRLDPRAVQGRDVQVGLELACPSLRRLENLRGVRFSILATDRAGRQEEIVLPMHVDLSPGWETCIWHVRFGPELAGCSLRLNCARAGAGVALRHIGMSALPTAGAESAEPANATPANATLAGGPRINLIAGGDFETGRRSFYASHLRTWLNGEQTAAPLAVQYDSDAVVGGRSLRLLVPSGTGRIGFGPLNLAPAAERAGGDWHLKFYARAAATTQVSVTLRSRWHKLGETTFTWGSDWQVFTHRFRVAADSPAARRELETVELVLDVHAEGHEPVECRLDAVGLTDAPVDGYLQAEPIEVGITGPAPLAGDLNHLLAEDETAEFTVDLAANPVGRPALPEGLADASASEPAGTLAVDVLDPWDRSVWSRTSQPQIPASGKVSEPVSVLLPRGYYRLLATLWSGEPGASQILSQDSQAIAVISFRDVVPLGNRYGLTAADETVSGFTTALGAGWVRMNLPAPRVETRVGAWDLSLWDPALAFARQAGIELVAAVTLPGVSRLRQPFLEEWLASSPLQPIGLVVSPPSASTQPANDYRQETEWVTQVALAQSPRTRVIFDLSALPPDHASPPALPTGGNLVLGYASTQGILPERSEPLLEKIGEDHSAAAHVWDLGVPVRLSGNLLGGRNLLPVEPPSAESLPVSRLESPIDPALAASRMIRSVLIRALAGTEMVCCDALALDPPLSIHQSDHQRLHEPDLAPRPALVAFERMTSLLNDATLVRWIDQPDGCRILHFEKDDGGAVAAIWRPFGLSPTHLSFAGLPATVVVIDCFGTPEPVLSHGNLRLIVANETVRYLVAGPGQAALLAEAVHNARMRPDLTATSATGLGQAGVREQIGVE